MALLGEGLGQKGGTESRLEIRPATGTVQYSWSNLDTVSFSLRTRSYLDLGRQACCLPGIGLAVQNSLDFHNGIVPQSPMSQTTPSRPLVGTANFAPKRRPAQALD